MGIEKEGKEGRKKNFFLIKLRIACNIQTFRYCTVKLVFIKIRAELFRGIYRLNCFKNFSTTFPFLSLVTRAY